MNHLRSRSTSRVEVRNVVNKLLVISFAPWVAQRNARKEKRKARHAGNARWACFFTSLHSLDPDPDSVTKIPGDWFGPDVLERGLSEAIKTDLLFGELELPIISAVPFVGRS
jgi:hypothetical protein